MMFSSIRAVIVPVLAAVIVVAAGTGSVFVDGDEFAYYSDSPDDFWRGYHRMKQSALTLVPETLRQKHISRTQAGDAVYYDILAAEDWGVSRKPTPAYVPSNFMTTEERLKFLERNVYYALDAADEYIWFYSQAINWWRDLVPPGEAPGPKSGLPTEVAAAVVSARTKIDRGQPLGFDIGEPVARRWEKAAKAFEAAVKK